MKNALAIGFFDGVHLGHREILDGAASVITFSNHPLSVLAPARAPKLILSPEERFAALRACGVERLTVVDFTPELAALTPADFAARWLLPELDRLGAAGSVRCGANWRFGCGGRGDAAALRAMGCRVEVAPYATYRDEPVSSSRIRAALAEERLADASAMLGRAYRLSGRVVAGKGLGRSLGFPTVNLALANPCPPLACGVYLVRAAGRAGLANYGRAPTLGEKAWQRPVLEIHFLDTPPDDSELTVEFADFIRPERTFASLAELKEQIARDCARARERSEA